MNRLQYCLLEISEFVELTLWSVNCKNATTDQMFDEIDSLSGKFFLLSNDKFLFPQNIFFIFFIKGISSVQCS